MKTSKRATKRALTENLQDKIRIGELKPNNQIFAKREFTITIHAQIRMQELGIKILLDCDNLVLIKGSDFYSNRFKKKIKKYSRTGNRTNSYWTDGSFVYVCRSRRAGNFTVVTVL